MKRLYIALSALMAFSAVNAQRNNSVIKDIAEKKYAACPFAGIVPMADGESYAQLSVDGRTVVQYEYKSGKAVATLFDASKARGASLSKIDGFQFDPQNKNMFVYNKSVKPFRRVPLAKYYTFDIQRNKLYALIDSACLQRDPVYSPNGRSIVFSVDNDLYLKKMDYDGIVMRMTRNGDSAKYNGVSDWLYEEEFSVRNLSVWAPDNRFFAFVTLDDIEVLKQTLTTYSLSVDNLKDIYNSTSSYHYPKAGQNNPVPAVFVYDAFYKSIKRVPLPNDGFDYVTRIMWTNEAETFAVFVLNRNQNHVRLYEVNCKSLMFNALFEETAKQYYEPEWINKVQFLPGNKFIFPSDRDGHRHLYLYNANGIQLSQLTKGNYDVTDFYGCDTVKNICYYQAAMKSPLSREVYAVDGKGVVTCLTKEEGVSSAQFNANYSYFLCANSTLNAPATVTVRNAAGKVVRTLDTAKPAARAGQQKKEFLPIVSGKDTLYAWVMKPDNFNASTKYPLVVMQYAAPGAHNVTDSYSYGFEQVLAASGYVVLCVDVHGSDARGRDWRKYSYQRQGVQEANDLVAAARKAGSLPYVDGKRIGIYGWSYGGYMALMAMTTGQPVFAAGVAIAPVTDWRLYDSAYGERYMRRPQENGSYDMSSVVKRAANLNGALLLVHGTKDDNVQIENTYTLADKLVSIGKPFNMMVYPNRNHQMSDAVTRTHLYNTVIDFFDTKLK